MQQIKDPMISCNGRIYSLAGLKLLLQEVTKNVSGGKTKSSERKNKHGKV
ncbi:MAG: hypothetical protein IKA32_11095 [Lentisphaeria bacterium]|nr:hypothetical protein [Lentisphaeria bacterium]